MKQEKFYDIVLISESNQMIEDALEIAGKVEFTKDDPVMEIPITGKIILNFDESATQNRIIRVDLRK